MCLIDPSVLCVFLPTHVPTLTAVLSGKELFKYNASLFVDDDGALDASEEDSFSKQQKADADLEEAKLKAETERAQAEQKRLSEAAQIEIEIRKQKEDARRAAAADPNRATFEFCGVIVTAVVFEEEEEEDLVPFPEAHFIDMSTKVSHQQLQGSTEGSAAVDKSISGDVDKIGGTETTGAGTTVSPATG